jgi:hypothetical protein
VRRVYEDNGYQEGIQDSGDVLFDNIRRDREEDVTIIILKIEI